MLNNLDLLSKFNDKLITQQERCASKIEKYIPLLELDNFDWLNYNADTPEYEISSDYKNSFIAYFDRLCNTTIYNPDGLVIALTREDETEDDWIIVRYKDAIHNDRNVAEIIQQGGMAVPTFTFRFLGWDGTHSHGDCDFLGYPVQPYIEALGLSGLVSGAIQLCFKGELTPANLSSYLTSQGINLSGDLQNAYNLLIGYVSGSSAAEQSRGLLLAVRDLYEASKAENISVSVTDPNDIDFHASDYVVKTTIWFPIDTVITTISTVISTIVAFFNPVYSAVLTALTNAFNGIWTSLNESFGNTWEISEVGSMVDNECFATPIISGEVASSLVPVAIVNATKKYGYVKSENAFFTIFTWFKEGQESTINIEIFPQVNVDYRRWYDPTVHILYDHITNCVTRDSNPGTTASVVLYSGYKERVNASGWFENDTFSPADITKVQLPDTLYRSVKNYSDKWCTYSYFYALAFVAYRMLYAGFVQDDTEQNDVTYTATAVSSNNAWADMEIESGKPESYYLDILYSFLSYVQFVLANNEHERWTTFDDWSWLTTGLVNNVYHAILSLQDLNQTKYKNKFLRDFFYIFNNSVGLDDFNNNVNVKGIGYKWAIVPYFAISDKLLVYPPANRYSLKDRLIFNGLVIATTAYLAVKVGLLIRKRVHYAAQKRSDEIMKKAAWCQQHDDFVTYSEYRREAFIYNQTWGRLSGTKIDPLIQSWTNAQNIANMGAVVTSIPNVIQNNSDKVGVAVNLDPVIRLIK
jgi:hypothetical protein